MGYIKQGSLLVPGSLANRWLFDSHIRNYLEETFVKFSQLISGLLFSPGKSAQPSEPDKMLDGSIEKTHWHMSHKLPHKAGLKSGPRNNKETN